MSIAVVGVQSGMTEFGCLVTCWRNLPRTETTSIVSCLSSLLSAAANWLSIFKCFVRMAPLRGDWVKRNGNTDSNYIITLKSFTGSCQKRFLSNPIGEWWFDQPLHRHPLLQNLAFQATDLQDSRAVSCTTLYQTCQHRSAPFFA
jgi:hypothetical protein